MRYPGLLASFVFVACAAPSHEDAELGSDRAALVNRVSPYTHDFETTYAPSLGVSGYAYYAPDDVSPSAVHNLVFSNGADTVAEPVDYVATGGNYASVASGDSYQSTPAFTTYLTSALSQTSADLISKIDQEKLKLLRDIFGKFGVTLTLNEIQSRLLGYTPIRARWARSQYASVPPMESGIYKRFDYPDPTAVAELRERGARLYCAARTAVREQAAHPESTLLGEQIGLPLTILGQKIDIGVVQATLAIDGPQRFTGAPAGSPQPNDGAQAFQIPLLAGARVIPIRGISKVLELLPELRHPIILATGDTEQKSALPAKAIVTGKTRFCWPTCFTWYTSTWDNPEVDQTVSHADAIGSSSSGLGWSTKFPLFTVGALTVDMTLTANLGLGTPVPGLNDRLFKDEWAVPARTTQLSTLNAFSTFDDSAFTKTAGYLFYLPYPVSVASGAGYNYTFTPPDPIEMRALANDDHHVATKTGLSLTATATGTAGASMGPLVIGLKGEATLGGSFNLEHHVRDAMTVYRGASSALAFPPRYVTNVVVTPQTAAQIDLKVGLTMNLKMDLPIGPDLDKTITLISASTSKVFGGNPWPENRRLRLGTGASGPDATNQPATVSHLPGEAPSTFNSFASQSVDACLGDATPNPPVPPPCGSTDGPVSTPRANVCVYAQAATGLSATGLPPKGFGTPEQWATACTNPTAAAAAMAGGTTTAAYPCYRDLLVYLCSPVSRNLTSPVGVSHILEMSGDPRFGNALAACFAALPTLAPNDVVDRLVTFRLCDDSARLLSESEIVSMASSSGPTTPEPVTKVPNCR